ncbi:hypothetical protein D3C72_2449430 [compost metagenome]
MLTGQMLLVKEQQTEHYYKAVMLEILLFLRMIFIEFGWMLKLKPMKCQNQPGALSVVQLLKVGIVIQI